MKRIARAGPRSRHRSSSSSSSSSSSLRAATAVLSQARRRVMAGLFRALPLWLALCPMVSDAATWPVRELPVAAAPPVVTLRWSAPAPGASTRVEGSLRTPLALDTSPWRNRSGRLYMVLPARAGGALLVRFAGETGGPLLSGQLQPGQRALIFTGVLPALLRDNLTLEFLADGRALHGPQQLEFRFELDLE